MPWASKQQQKWGNSPAGIRALGGQNRVKEWNDSTNFQSLPQKAPQQKRQPGALLKKKKPYLPQGVSSGM